MKDKIKIWLVEYFNENDNTWEWGNVIRQSESTKDQARKETIADNFSCIYNKDKEQFEGETEDIEYLAKNWEESTRAWDLSI